MNINVTLLIQIINFGIAWVLIKNFLVAPAMRVYAQETAFTNDLILRRDALKQTLGNIHDKQYALWHGWYLSTQRSIQESYKTVPIKQSVNMPASSPVILMQETQELANRITKMVVEQLQELS